METDDFSWGTRVGLGSVNHIVWGVNAVLFEDIGWTTDEALGYLHGMWERDNRGE